MKYWLIAVLLLAGLWARCIFAGIHAQDPALRTPDEGMYTTYASVIVAAGIPKGTQISIGKYNKDSALHAYPAPTRIGYIYPLALTMKLLGRTDLDVGILLSRAISVLSLLLVVYLAWRYWGYGVACFSAMFMAFSPLELALSRRTWQDGLVTLIGGCLVWSAASMLRGSARRTHLLLFGLIGAYGLLTKDSLVVPFFTLALYCRLHWLRHGDRQGWLLAPVVAGAVALAGAALAAASGGYPVIMESYLHFMSYHAQNQYVLEYQSGPWYTIVGGLWLFGPHALAACLAGAVLAFTRKAPQRDILRMFAVTWTGFVIVASLVPSFKNLRFLSAVNVPFYLLAGVAADAAAGWLRVRIKKIGVILTVAAALGVMGFDADNFYGMFITRATRDLTFPQFKDRSIYRTGGPSQSLTESPGRTTL